jgi:cytochrome c oxidase cbb3-type subunit 3
MSETNGNSFDVKFVHDERGIKDLLLWIEFFLGYFMYFSKRQSCILTASLLVLGLGWVLTPGQARAQAQTTDPAVQRGKAQFEQSCAACHGARATGGIGPNLVESDVVQIPRKYGDLVVRVIESGRPERGMPAFPMLTSQNISDIVAFLRARGAEADATGEGEGYPLQQLLTGNAEAGERYFNGPGKCATCHSPTGDLKGIAGKQKPVDLEQNFLFPSGPESTATVSLRDGKQVQGKLVHLDPFYVSILDTDGMYRSWPMADARVQVKNPLAGHLDLLKTISDKDIHDVFAYLETLK